MEPFFQKSYKALVESPNGTAVWWHSLPLPDGNRVNGNNPDKDLQLKMWRAMQIADEGGLARKRVLDIGANDGFFTVAAAMAGAARSPRSTRTGRPGRRTSTTRRAPGASTPRSSAETS